MLAKCHGSAKPTGQKKHIKVIGADLIPRDIGNQLDAIGGLDGSGGESRRSYVPFGAPQRVDNDSGLHFLAAAGEWN